jgi:uncharacterized damage-inducible protein DinB
VDFVNKADIAVIFDYNYWANRRILDAARKISQAQLCAHSAFPRGGLLGTLVHILDAECGWRLLLQRGEETEDLSEKDFPTLLSLEERWHDEEEHMRAYLAGLGDEEMQAVVRYTNPSGIKRERVRWHGLYHVVNHGTQHRSEAAAMLTDLGQSPGDIDFTVFLVESVQRGA